MKQVPFTSPYGIKVINQQNVYLKNIAQHGGYDSEFNYINNEFNVRQTMEDAMDEYLRMG